MDIKMKRPELSDRDLINSYLKYADTRSCEMTFANTYLWSRHYGTGFAIVDDMLVFSARWTACTPTPFRWGREICGPAWRR